MLPAVSGSSSPRAAEYHAKLLAGWNIVPISPTFPVTVFVVRNLQGIDLGCSANVFGDYVIVDREGLETDHVTLPREIGYSCGLSPGTYWHDWTPSNLMYKSWPAGENVKWFQRSSTLLSTR